MNIIRGNLKPLSNQAGVIEITKRTSHESHNVSLFNSLCRCLLIHLIPFTKVENSLSSLARKLLAVKLQRT